MKHIHSYYSPNDLYNRIIQALDEIGKDPSKVTLDDLQPVDEFHIRGNVATRELIELAGFTPEMHILDVGCGWGLAGIYCAKKYNAVVTGIDIDPDVFPYLRLHSEINKVKIATMKRGFGGFTGNDLKNFDVLIGADICFWDKLVRSLKRLINRALKTGPRMVLIADPGRPTFNELAEYFTEKRGAKILDWTVQRPRRIQGRILKVGSL